MDFGDRADTKSGSGDFTKFVPQGIQDLKIDLTAKADLDIELWDGKNFVVGWQADGANALIPRDSKVFGKITAWASP